MKKQFPKRELKEKMVLSLFFVKQPAPSNVLDLYLAGSIRANFTIREDDIEGESGDKTENWKREENVAICDKVLLTPRKGLQQLLGKKMSVDEIKPYLTDSSKGKADELINLFYNKLNKIYAKQKLYGREIKDFSIN